MDIEVLGRAGFLLTHIHYPSLYPVFFAPSVHHTVYISYAKITVYLDHDHSSRNTYSKISEIPKHLSHVMIPCLQYLDRNRSVPHAAQLPSCIDHNQRGTPPCHAPHDINPVPYTQHAPLYGYKSRHTYPTSQPQQSTIKPHPALFSCPPFGISTNPLPPSSLFFNNLT